MGRVEQVGKGTSSIIPDHRGDYACKQCQGKNHKQRHMGSLLHACSCIQAQP